MASIERRSRATSETWRVVWYQDVNGTRRKQQRAFTDPADAARFQQLVEGSGNRWPAGWEPIDPRANIGITFGRWALEAIESRNRANERTKADYRRDLTRHFDLLAGVPLEQITERHIAQWEANRKAVGLSAKTIRNLHGFASSILADAKRQRPPLVDHNPFEDRLRASAVVHVEEMTFLTPPEFARVLAHVRPEYRDLIRLLFGTGLRFGEATALQVRDVELFGKRKTLTVTKAWKRTGSKTWAVGEPKTPRSRRTVSLGAELVDTLIPLVASRRADELLFPGSDGGRLPHSEVYKRGWAPAVARGNVCDACWEPQRSKRNRQERPRLPEPCDHDSVLGKQPRIHDLRHSHVAALISAGVPIAAVSRRLGHSSISITMDRYGHLDPAIDSLVDAATDLALAVR